MTQEVHRTFEDTLIAFRADASLQIGSGHVVRCLTLADELRSQGAECHFVCREHPGHLCDVIEERGFKVHRLPLDAQETGSLNLDTDCALWLGTSWQQDAASCATIFAKHPPACLVVDHYALDHRWETSVMAGLGATPRLLVIDDLADRRHVADLLLDQNLGRTEEDYKGLVPETSRLLVGPHYAMLRPEFREWRERSLSRRTEQSKLKRLLINLGGVDKDNITGQILGQLNACNLPDDLEIEVVMGATAPWRDAIIAQAEAMRWVTRVAVNADDIARRMAEADLAIGAAGSTAWERCCLGLPTMIVILADNQHGIAEALAENGAASILDLPNLGVSLSTWLIKLAEPEILSRISGQAAELVDGQGVGRVRLEIQHLDNPRLRAMQEFDLERVLAWRNHPEIRRHMYTQRPIPLEEHRAWFEHVRKDSQRHLLIYEQNQNPSGFVSLAIEDVQECTAVWGFYLAPEAPRGSGLVLGQCTLHYAFNILGLRKLYGEVLAGNERSQKFHQKLGFRHEATLREHFYDGNTYYNVIRFGLLAEEWRESQGADIS